MLMMNNSEAHTQENNTVRYSEIYGGFLSTRNASTLSRPNSRQFPTVENKMNDVQNRIKSRSLSITPRNCSSANIQLQSRERSNVRCSSASLKRFVPNKTIERSNSVYKTDESEEREHLNNIEEEIVKGNRISIPHVNTASFDDIITPIQDTQDLQYKTLKVMDSKYPDFDLSTNSPRSSDRDNLLSRGPSLMLGSGKIRKSNDTETLELHIDESEFSEYQEQMISHVVSVTIATSGANTPGCALKEGKLSPRPREVILPKTYITKSGSLLLYSDSNITQGTDIQNSEKEIKVKGRKLSPQTLVPQAYPYWGKHVSKGKLSRNRDFHYSPGWIYRNQRDYIGINKQNMNNKPYTWEPEKLISDSDKEGIKTVSNLSEAVLAYRSTVPSARDKYLAVMKKSRDGQKTHAEKKKELQAKQLQRLSNWTRDWINMHGPVLFKKPDKVGKDNVEDTVLIKKIRKSLKMSVKAPVNTPSVGAKHTYFHTLNKTDYEKLLSTSPRIIFDPTKGETSPKYQ